MEMWKSLCSASLRAAIPTFPQPCQRLSLERTPETCRGVDAPPSPWALPRPDRTVRNERPAAVGLRCDSGEDQR